MAFAAFGCCPLTKRCHGSPSRTPPPTRLLQLHCVINRRLCHWPAVPLYLSLFSLLHVVQPTPLILAVYSAHCYLTRFQEHIDIGYLIFPLPEVPSTPAFSPSFSLPLPAHSTISKFCRPARAVERTSGFFSPPLERITGFVILLVMLVYSG